MTQSRRGARFRTYTIFSSSMENAEQDLLDRSVPVASIERVVKRRAKVKVFSLPMKEKIQFFQQLQTAMAGHIPMPKIIEMAATSTQNPNMKATLKIIMNSLDEGETLSDGMRRSGAFDALTMGLVTAGEESSTLQDSCKQIKDILRRNSSIQRRVATIMIYPIIILIVTIVCIYIVVTRIVPAVSGFFASAKAELPLPTKVLMNLSDFATGQPILAMGILILIVVLFIAMPKIIQKTKATHEMLLKMPPIGKFTRDLLEETFTRSMVSMFAARVEPKTALRLLRGADWNYAYKAAIGRTLLSVYEGERMGDALAREDHVFSPIVIASIRFGEEASQLELVMESLAQELSADILENVDRFKQTLQPVLTIVIGLIVFGILAAIMVPLFMLPTLI